MPPDLQAVLVQRFMRDQQRVQDVVARLTQEREVLLAELRTVEMDRETLRRLTSEAQSAHAKMFVYAQHLEGKLRDAGIAVPTGPDEADRG